MHITVNMKMKVISNQNGIHDDTSKDYFSHAYAKNIFVALGVTLKASQEGYIFDLKPCYPCNFCIVFLYSYW